MHTGEGDRLSNRSFSISQLSDLCNLDLDLGSGQVAYRRVSLIDTSITYTPNFVEIGKTFGGRTHVRTLRPALLGRLGGNNQPVNARDNAVRDIPRVVCNTSHCAYRLLSLFDMLLTYDSYHNTWSHKHRRSTAQYWVSAPEVDDVTPPIDDIIDEKYGPSELVLHAANRR